MIQFSGAATPFKAADLVNAAHLIGCAVPVVQAVQDVETGGQGGFLTDGSGRPRILFEALQFSQATGGRFNKSHPSISSPVWNPALYQGGTAEYVRLAQAVSLDQTAALSSASWGMFQVLGSNYRSSGYASVSDFVTGMATSEGEQLAAFGEFCNANGLSILLRERDWEQFSRRYNGPSYRALGYVQKLEAAYARAVTAFGHASVDPADAVPAALCIGSAGPLVARLQAALIDRTGMSIATDGCFGPGTEVALRRYQAANKLTPDGVAGPATLAALGLDDATTTETVEA